MTTRYDEMVKFTWAKDRCYYCTTNRFGPYCYDCSGWVWTSFNHVGLYLPKEDTAGFSTWAHNTGHEIQVSRYLDPNKIWYGDILIHDRYDNPFRSSGPRGHTGWVVSRSGNTIFTSESASSEGGVGIYPRSIGFWCMIIRIPGVLDQMPGTDPGPPPIDLQAIYTYLNRRKRGAMSVNTIRYIDQDHSFWIDENGHMKHRYAPPDAVEDLTAKVGLNEVLDRHAGIVCDIQPNNWLTVRTVTDQGRMIEFSWNNWNGSPWHWGVKAFD